MPKVRSSHKQLDVTYDDFDSPPPVFRMPKKPAKQATLLRRSARNRVATQTSKATDSTAMVSLTEILKESSPGNSQKNSESTEEITVLKDLASIVNKECKPCKRIVANDADVAECLIQFKFEKKSISNSNMLDARKERSCKQCNKSYINEVSEEQHLKLCSAQTLYNSILSASELQNKQHKKEAKSVVNLNSLKDKNVVKSVKKTRSTSSDPDLALALALSESVAEQTVQQKVQQEEYLINVGLMEEVVAQRRKHPLIAHHSRGESMRFKPAKVAKKRRVICRDTALTKRSKEERDRIISDKVALILMAEGRDIKQRMLNYHPSRKLQGLYNQSCALWRSSEAGLETALQQFYVSELQTFVQPMDQCVDRWLKNLSQIPGRHNYSLEEKREICLSDNEGSEYDNESEGRETISECNVFGGDHLADSNVVHDYCTQLAMAEMLQNSTCNWTRDEMEWTICSGTNGDKAIDNPVEVLDISSPEILSGSGNSDTKSNLNCKRDDKSGAQSCVSKELGIENTSCSIDIDDKSCFTVQRSRSKTFPSLDTCHQLVEDWSALLESGVQSDATIKTADTTIRVHSIVLLARCPLMYKELESSTGMQLEWNTYSSESVSCLIKFLYCATCKVESKEDPLWIHLYDLSLKYEVKGLIIHLERLYDNKCNKEDAFYRLGSQTLCKDTSNKYKDSFTSIHKSINKSKKPYLNLSPIKAHSETQNEESIHHNLPHESASSFRLSDKEIDSTHDDTLPNLELMGCNTSVSHNNMCVTKVKAVNTIHKSDTVNTNQISNVSDVNRVNSSSNHHLLKDSMSSNDRPVSPDLFAESFGTSSINDDIPLSLPVLNDSNHTNGNLSNVTQLNFHDIQTKSNDGNSSSKGTSPECVILDEDEYLDDKYDRNEECEDLGDKSRDNFEIIIKTQDEGASPTGIKMMDSGKPMKENETLEERENLRGEDKKSKEDKHNDDFNISSETIVFSQDEFNDDEDVIDLTQNSNDEIENQVVVQTSPLEVNKTRNPNSDINETNCQSQSNTKEIPIQKINNANLTIDSNSAFKNCDVDNGEGLLAEESNDVADVWEDFVDDCGGYNIFQDEEANSTIDCNSDVARMQTNPLPQNCEIIDQTKEISKKAPTDINEDINNRSRDRNKNSINNLTIGDQTMAQIAMQLEEMDDDEVEGIGMELNDNIRGVTLGKCNDNMGEKTPAKPTAKDAVTPDNLRANLSTDFVITPLPDYKNMTSPLLKKELEAYGIRPLRRKQAILLLNHIYEQRHPLVTDSEGSYLATPSPVQMRQNVKGREPLSKKVLAKNFNSIQEETTKASMPRKLQQIKKQTKEKQQQQSLELDSQSELLNSSQESVGSESSSYECLEESLFHSPQKDFCQDEQGVGSDEDSITPSQQVNLQDSLLHLVRGHSVLYRKVLLYEPIWLKDIQRELKKANIKCSSNKLVDFLDQQCITFRMESTRNRPRKKSSTSKSPPKRKRKGASTSPSKTVHKRHKN